MLLLLQAGLEDSKAAENVEETDAAQQKNEKGKKWPNDGKHSKRMRRAKSGPMMARHLQGFKFAVTPVSSNPIAIYSGFPVIMFQAANCKKNLTAEFDAAAEEGDARAPAAGQKPLTRLRSEQKPKPPAEAAAYDDEDNDGDEMPKEDEAQEKQQQTPNAKSIPSSNPKEHEEEPEERNGNGDGSCNSSWSYWYNNGAPDAYNNAWAGYDSWQPRSSSWAGSWGGSWDDGASASWWHGNDRYDEATGGVAGDGRTGSKSHPSRSIMWRQTSWYKTLNRATTTDLPAAAATPKKVTSSPTDKSKQLDKRKVQIL